MREHKEPDCMSCIHLKDCDAGEAGHFCAYWQSEEPKPQGKDPNAAWLRGDDDDDPF